MAPTKLKKNIDYIKVLSKANKQQQKAILQAANKELIECLCECALNIVNGNVPLKNSDLQKLQKHKSRLRGLSDPSIKIKEKRILLQQKGGFLPILLAPILSLAGQLLANSIT